VELNDLLDTPITVTVKGRDVDTTIQDEFVAVNNKFRPKAKGNYDKKELSDMWRDSIGKITKKPPPWESIGTRSSYRHDEVAMAIANIPTDDPKILMLRSQIPPSFSLSVMKKFSIDIDV
jgi:hypothetical protein